VDAVRVVPHSFVNLLHGRPLAVTRRRRIYLRGSAAEFFADTELVLHEYFHVLRQWEPGELTVPALPAGLCPARLLEQSFRDRGPALQRAEQAPPRAIAHGVGGRPPAGFIVVMKL
jgi:hypothetical protein